MSARIAAGAGSVSHRGAPRKTRPFSHLGIFFPVGPLTRSYGDPAENRIGSEEVGVDEESFAGLICDFCSGSPVVKGYPALSFSMETQIPGIGIGSESGWAACQICADLVDADDWDGLATRSMETFQKAVVGLGLPPMDIGTEMQEKLTLEFAALHQQFRESRIRIR